MAIVVLLVLGSAAAEIALPPTPLGALTGAILVEMGAIGVPLGVALGARSAGFAALGACFPLCKRSWLVAGTTGLGVAMAGVPLQTWMQQVSHQALGDGMQELMSLSSPLEWALAGVAFLIVAPVLEEAVLRGYIFRAVEARIGAVAAVLATAFVFAGLHPVPVAWPTYLLLGLSLGVLRIRAAAWGPGIMLHACFNGFALLLANHPSWGDVLGTAPGSGLASLLLVAGGLGWLTDRGGRS